jgi:hypothetical protein
VLTQKLQELLGVKVFCSSEYVIPVYGISENTLIVFGHNYARISSRRLDIPNTPVELSSPLANQKRLEYAKPARHSTCRRDIRNTLVGRPPLPLANWEPLELVTVRRTFSASIPIAITALV